MKTDWDRWVREVSSRSFCVQNAKPSHQTARNIFKDDKDLILAAAAKYGFRLVGDPKAKVVSFVRTK